MSLLACTAGLAQHKDPCTTAGTNNDWLGIQTVRLWPGDAPEAKGNACEDTPTLSIFSPHWGNGNGSAVIVMPGGGYVGLAGVHEGREFADWFTERGFHAFVLSYRLSSNGYLLPVPLLDARRAIQTVRARAQDYHIDPNRIVIIGFSAAGTWRPWLPLTPSRAIRKQRMQSTASPAGPITWCWAIRGSAP